MIERKTAIITGAASGIGLETARRFSKDPKYNPIFAVDKSSLVKSVFNSLESPNIIPLQLDLRDRSQISQMVSTAEKTGRIDVVANVAGVISAGKLEMHRKNNERKPLYEEMEEINVIAPIVIEAEAVQIMKRNGGGTIVNVTSSKHFFPDYYRVEYMQGKQLVSKVTRRGVKQIRKDYGVRLADVQPGNTKTNIDRGVWTNNNGKLEMEAVQKFNDWWRKTFGNDPKKVAEVIYQVAEGKKKANVTYVGFDAKLGFALSFIPFSGMIFFAGSYSAYKLIEAVAFIKKKIQGN